MTYQEALSRVQRLQEYSVEFNRDLFYIVVPANYSEMEKFLKEYEQPSHRKTDLDCRAYCTDENFSVYRFDVNPQNKKTIV